MRLRFHATQISFITKTLTVIFWHEYISDNTLTHEMDALQHRTDYDTSSSNVHFMFSFSRDFMNQWMLCISFSYRQITCCSIGSEKLQWCISLGEIPAGINTTAVHIESPTRCNSVSKFYFIFIWSSTCFGRHTAHHQEPKTALAASGFAYVEGCWPCSCWTLTQGQQPPTYAKPEAASAVSCSWWWTVCRLKHIKLHIIRNKILIHCCILLDFLYELYYDARIHKQEQFSISSLSCAP